MSNLGRNIATKTSTNSEASAASSTTTVTAIKGKQFQIVSFSGASNDQNFKVQLLKGSTVIATLEGPAVSSVGHDYNDNGPVGGSNTAISVVVTPAASGQCTANLSYKVIF